MEVKTIWWYTVQGGGHERMEYECIVAGETQVNSLNDFSWTYRRHWHDGLVALPQMWMVWWDHGDVTSEWNNPTRLGCGVKVSCSRATCYQQSFFKFSSQFSPVIADQYLFIFVKLEEDNICLFYNFPFRQTHHYVLRSLAIVKLVPIYIQVCRY